MTYSSWAELARSSYRGASNELVATALAYLAPYDEVSLDVRAEQFTFDLPIGSSKEVRFVAPQMGGVAESRIFQMTLWTAVEAGSGSAPKVLGARAQLRRDEAAARKYRFFDLAIPSTTFPDAAHNVFVAGRLIGRFAEDAKCLCPNCLGNGSEKTMKIPKEDLESGATGYALFSSNKLNGREACPVCGGAGGKYLRWYLDEHPELATVAFKAGSGLLRR